MKVLVITPLYPKDKTVSPKNMSYAVHYLIKGLSKFGIDVVKVIIPTQLFIWREVKIKNTIQSNYIDGVLVENKPMFYIPKIGYILSKKDMNYFQENIKGIDLIITHFGVAAGIAERIRKRYNIPYITTLHNTDLKDLFLSKKIIQNSKKIFSRSWTIKKKLEERKIIVNGVIYSGIDKDLIYNRSNCISNKKINFISVCNLIKRKNINIVLKALAELPKNLDWKYKIIGDGPELKNLKNLSKKLLISDKVDFLGLKPRDYCMKEMRHSNVFVMTSSNETFGLVYLEAMAAGCIIIGSKNEGADGLIVNGVNGYLVDSNSIINLRDTFQSLYSVSQENILENSYKTIKEFTSDKAQAHYANLIKESIENEN